MPSKWSWGEERRSRSAGFTILEATLAFAILGMVLAGVYSLSVGTLRQQTSALAEYQLTAMARAVLDEYIVTYPEMGLSGTYKQKWTWTVREEPHPPIIPTSLDHQFSFFKVIAAVRSTDTDANTIELSTVIARRAVTQ